MNTQEIHTLLNCVELPALFYIIWIAPAITAVVSLCICVFADENKYPIRKKVFGYLFYLTGGISILSTALFFAVWSISSSESNYPDEVILTCSMFADQTIAIHNPSSDKTPKRKLSDILFEYPSVKLFGNEKVHISVSYSIPSPSGPIDASRSATLDLPDYLKLMDAISKRIPNPKGFNATESMPIESTPNVPEIVSTEGIKGFDSVFKDNFRIAHIGNGRFLVKTPNFVGGENIGILVFDSATATLNFIHNTMTIADASGSSDIPMGIFIIASQTPNSDIVINASIRMPINTVTLQGDTYPIFREDQTELTVTPEDTGFVF